MLLFGDRARIELSKIKSPREKKALSLTRDRRNIYGENAKASRKAIPRRKQLSHMGERRAVSQILNQLREGGEEEEAQVADVRAKTAIAEQKLKAFKKLPDAPLGVVIKSKLAKRGKQRRVVSADSARIYFHDETVFDIPYKSAIHKQAILHELRYRTGRPHFGPHQKKFRRLIPYEHEVPVRWREAILRDAPLLKGFFAEEPKWRDKMLLWCEEILAVAAATDMPSAKAHR